MVILVVVRGERWDVKPILVEYETAVAAVVVVVASNLYLSSSSSTLGLNSTTS